MPNPPATDPEDDRALVQASQKGDLRAFGDLVQRHQGAIRAYLAVRLADVAEAEDLSQEVFLTAYRKLSEYDCTRPLLPWLRGIAHHLWRNHTRKFRAYPLGGNVELQTLLDHRLASEWNLDRESLRLQALNDCLEGVDPETRELLQARYAEGLSVDELSARRGRKHSALTMQLHRIRAALAACVQGKLACSNAPWGTLPEQI
jgi:RNA polymerase sigma-70 factor (ECF subfamily)